MTRISFRCSEEFLAAVDSARGDVPRELWVRGVVGRAVEQALSELPLGAPPRADDARGIRPKESLDSAVHGNVGPKREVQPIPKRVK